MILLLVTYSPIAHSHPPPPPSFCDRSPRQAQAGAQRRRLTKPPPAAAGGCGAARLPAAPRLRRASKFVSAPAPPSLHTPSGEGGSKKKATLLLPESTKAGSRGQRSRQRERETGRRKRELGEKRSEFKRQREASAREPEAPPPGRPALGPGRPRTLDRKSWAPEARGGPSLPHQIQAIIHQGALARE
ncbi:uncharacterized protein [Muntiacus reevesi]|uniref:uncharacterized protein isoform X2 n=1 Tax=Muntiacus reevesi TaxID=9886 RepID=UPI003306B5A6